MSEFIQNIFLKVEILLEIISQFSKADIGAAICAWPISGQNFFEPEATVTCCFIDCTNMPGHGGLVVSMVYSYTCTNCYYAVHGGRNIFSSYSVKIKFVDANQLRMLFSIWRLANSEELITSLFLSQWRHRCKVNYVSS